MFDERILTILREKVFYMGTTCDNVPRVRPMRPFVDDEGNIWLISHKDTEKTREIEINNKVEICTLSDNNDLLRLQGQLIPGKDLAAGDTEKVRGQIIAKLPGIKDFFGDAGDANMTIYKLVVDNFVFRAYNDAGKAELHFKQ